MDICIFTNLDFGNAVVKVLCRVHLEAAVLTYDHGEEEGAFVYISPYNIQAYVAFVARRRGAERAGKERTNNIQGSHYNSLYSLLYCCLSRSSSRQTILRGCRESICTA